MLISSPSNRYTIEAPSGDTSPTSFVPLSPVWSICPLPLLPAFFRNISTSLPISAEYTSWAPSGVHAAQSPPGRSWKLSRLQVPRSRSTDQTSEACVLGSNKQAAARSPRAVRRGVSRYSGPPTVCSTTPDRLYQRSTLAGGVCSFAEMTPFLEASNAAHPNAAAKSSWFG